MHKKRDKTCPSEVAHELETHKKVCEGAELKNHVALEKNPSASVFSLRELALVRLIHIRQCGSRKRHRCIFGFLGCIWHRGESAWNHRHWWPVFPRLMYTELSAAFTFGYQGICLDNDIFMDLAFKRTANESDIRFFEDRNVWPEHF